MNSKYPLIILIDKKLLKCKLIEDVEHYKIIDVVNFPVTENIVRYKFTLNKFHIFNLTEYDKILFLDADMFIFTNIDYIFEKAQEYDCIYSNYLTKRYNADTILPRGGFFICTPKEGFFENLINSDDFKNLLHYDDEHVLKEICFPKWKTITFEEIYLLDETMPLYFHGRWSYHFNYKDIIKMSDEDILTFFKEEVTKMAILYLRMKKIPSTEEKINALYKIFWNQHFLFNVKN